MAAARMDLLASLGFVTRRIILREGIFTGNTNRVFYSREFNLDVVRIVCAGERRSSITAILELPDQTLYN